MNAMLSLFKAFHSYYLVVISITNCKVGRCYYSYITKGGWVSGLPKAIWWNHGSGEIRTRNILSLFASSPSWQEQCGCKHWSRQLALSPWWRTYLVKWTHWLLSLTLAVPGITETLTWLQRHAGIFQGTSGNTQVFPSACLCVYRHWLYVLSGL